ncbi:MAG: hypothetical protein OXL68_14690 [Paracoccaceae bacterium]|nr:hypothetical protein [Paracoccaceae bacterium]
MAQPPEGRRRQRSIMTTDSEWELITSRARRAGMTTSQFIVHRTLDAADPSLAAATPPGPPPGVQRRMALAMLVIARIEERRLRDAGNDSIWDQLVAEESAFLDSEDLMGSESP